MQHKLTKSSPSIWRLLHTVNTVKILSIFVAFSKNVNFTYLNVHTVNSDTAIFIRTNSLTKRSSVLYLQISTSWFLLRHTVLCALEIAPITTRVVSWGSSTWFRSGQMGLSNEIRASISSQIKRQPNWPVVFKTNGHSSFWL